MANTTTVFMLLMVLFFIGQIAFLFFLMRSLTHTLTKQEDILTRIAIYFIDMEHKIQNLLPQAENDEPATQVKQDFSQAKQKYQNYAPLEDENLASLLESLEAESTEPLVKLSENPILNEGQAEITRLACQETTQLHPDPRDPNQT